MCTQRGDSRGERADNVIEEIGLPWWWPCQSVEDISLR